MALQPTKCASSFLATSRSTLSVNGRALESSLRPRSAQSVSGKDLAVLTTRGWNFLMVLVVFLTGAVAFQSATLSVVGLALLCWFLAAAFVFAVRVRLTTGQLRIHRVLHGRRGKLTGLVAGQPFTVEVVLASDSIMSLPWVRAPDRLPVLVRIRDGDSRGDGPVGGEQQIVLRYRGECPSAGSVRFDGLSVQVADMQGFFYHAMFVPEVQIYRVL